MNITMIPLSQLKPNEKNVRIHSRKQLEEYKRSVRMFGQTKAIVIDEDYRILIGNGLFEAMKELGHTEAACFMKPGMSEHDKLKMMMADNKIYSLGVDNLEAIENIISELGELKDFDIPGYEPDLLETITFDALSADDFMTGYGILDDDQKADMQKASERYDRGEDEFAAAAEEIRPTAPDLRQNLTESAVRTPDDIKTRPETNAPEEPSPALPRRFVICPKCGEKIWL